MPRKGPAPRRPLVLDPVYGSPVVSQLVNRVLSDGKRSTAESIVYGALTGCKEKSGNDPIATLKRALENVKPTVEVRSRRVGGATYQVPVEVKPARAMTLGMRWLVEYAGQRREKSMTERLMNFCMHQMDWALQLSVAKTFTKWQKRTKRSLTTAGKQKEPRTWQHKLLLI
jgi:small subunit ribosomal protein S7